MSALQLTWHGLGKATRVLWLVAGAALLLAALQLRFAAEMWLQPATVIVVARSVLRLSLLVLLWLGPGFLWGLGRHCQRWWLRLLSMLLAFVGWCVALLLTLFGVPLLLVWELFGGGS